MSDLTNPVSLKPIHPATYASVLLEAQCRLVSGEYETVQTGTGFIYRHKSANTYFLITNWHVITCRNPDKPEQLNVKSHGSPTRLSFCMPTKVNKLHFLPGEIDLYENGRPVWFEAKPVNGRVDVVAIPIDFSPECHVVAVQDFAETGAEIGIGQETIIVGFPFGRYEQNPFAIWKKAMIASEPGILLSKRPRFFLDTPGRPGMSGSPVYAVSEGIGVSPRAKAIFQDPSLSAIDRILQLHPESDFSGFAGNILRLVGIYSSSYNPELRNDPLREMGLGFSWHTAMIDKIFQDLVPGNNPHPPEI